MASTKQRVSKGRLCGRPWAGFPLHKVKNKVPLRHLGGTAEAGSHTFTVDLRNATPNSIVWSFTNPTAQATITNFEVVNAVAASMVVTAPTRSEAGAEFISKVTVRVAGIPTTVAGTVQSFTVTVKDAFGNIATGYTGTVNFSSTDAQAVLPASYTFNAADAGSRTFSVTLKTAGTQSVTVRDATNAAATGTQSNITVRASSVAASVNVSGFPATVAGVAKNFTVAIKDAYGNNCTNFVGTVTFSSSDAKAVLPASYTFIAADAGSRVFSATLKTAGTQSITATTGALSRSQTGIVVSAAAVSNFRLVAPVITAGVGFKLSVTALDAFGNIVTSYRGKVNLTTSNSSGSNSYSFSAKDAGVAQISYSLKTVGLQTIRVADSTNAAVFATITVNVLAK